MCAKRRGGGAKKRAKKVYKPCKKAGAKGRGAVGFAKKFRHMNIAAKKRVRIA